MSVIDLLDNLTGNPGPATLHNAAEWMQGRTLYGGASAMIAYQIAVRAFPDLPPLQAAQIGFVAPVGEEVDMQAKIIRQGRNVTQVRSEIYSGGGLSLTAFFLFAAEREANAVHSAPLAKPLGDGARELETVRTEKAPAFLKNNFELLRAQELSGPGEPVVRRWFRLKEHSALDPISTMILLGDGNPPGAMRAMQRQGPISSINWSFNILDANPATQDGWWLSENCSEHADNGYSSERLSMWNSDGRQVMSGLQSVAIFG